MAFFREWSSPPPPIVPLTPIDHSKEEQEGAEANSGRKRRRNDFSQSEDGPPPLAHAFSVNGRRILICNFNNTVFQVKLEFVNSM